MNKNAAIIWLRTTACLLAAILLSGLQAGATTSDYRGAPLPDISPTGLDLMGRPRLIPLNATLPVTGSSTGNSKEFDERMLALMRKWDVPGASVTVAKDGKVLLSRGYGWADIHKQQAVKPNSLFRIASVSKSLTALAAGKLYEQGKLPLDASFLSILPYDRLPHKHMDSRLRAVTVRNLLQSTVGWNRDRSGDPLFTPYITEAAERYSPTLRCDPDSIIRYWLERDLDCEPGTHFYYSNLAYTILGRTIEKASGNKFSDYVRQQILLPAGCNEMRPGRTCELSANEVVHYPFPKQEMAPSVFPNYTGMVPLTYGGNFSLEAMVSDTGWLSSSGDLVRLYSAVFDQHKIISDATLAELLKRPDVAEWQNRHEYFTSGFEVVAPLLGLKRIVYRQGSLPGTTAVVAHRDDGYTWSFLLNTRPPDGQGCQLEFTKLMWAFVNPPAKR